jgi:hypothetical protein
MNEQIENDEIDECLNFTRDELIRFCLWVLEEHKRIYDIPREERKKVVNELLDDYELPF